MSRLPEKVPPFGCTLGSRPCPYSTLRDSWSETLQLPGISYSSRLLLIIVYVFSNVNRLSRVTLLEQTDQTTECNKESRDRNTAGNVLTYNFRTHTLVLVILTFLNLIILIELAIFLRLRVSRKQSRFDSPIIKFADPYEVLLNYLDCFMFSKFFVVILHKTIFGFARS